MGYSLWYMCKYTDHFYATRGRTQLKDISKFQKALKVNLF